MRGKAESGVVLACLRRTSGFLTEVERKAAAALSKALKALGEAVKAARPKLCAYLRGVDPPASVLVTNQTRGGHIICNRSWEKGADAQCST